jgi:MarR family 2-MHQ and catechol resistance regulon transcriptional repressor
MTPRGSKTGHATEADGQLEGDARRLQTALSDLVRIYQFRDRKSICYYDISVTQCYALSSIATRGPMPLNDLATELYLDKSTASRVVGALVRKGYVRRSTDEKDARAVRLQTTEKGLALHLQITADLLEEMRDLVGDFDPSTRRAATRLIARLAEAAAKKFR